MPKQVIKIPQALVPVPVVLVSCKGREGGPNIITLAWVGVVNGDPPIVSISIRPSRHSFELIRDTKEFVINIPSESQVRIVDYCGVASGKHENKFEQARLTPVPATKVKAPLIEECAVNMECEVKQVISLGSHHVFLGEVVAIHADQEAMTEANRIDISKVQPIAYCPASGEYRGLKGPIGSYGFSKGKP